MYDAIPHSELVHRIMRDCKCPYGAAETIANLLEDYEEESGELLEYDSVGVRSTYVYYPSIKEAYKDLIGDPGEKSNDNMIDDINDAGYAVYFPKSKDDDGIIVQVE